MTRIEFEDLARNDPHGALIQLFDEQSATQETVLELAAHVQAPEAPAEA